MEGTGGRKMRCFTVMEPVMSQPGGTRSIGLREQPGNILSACFLCAWQGVNGVWGVSSEEVLCVLSEAPVLWQLLFLCFLEGETSVEGSGVVFQCQASCQVSENSS